MTYPKKKQLAPLLVETSVRGITERERIAWHIDVHRGILSCEHMLCKHMLRFYMIRMHRKNS